MRRRNVLVALLCGTALVSACGDSNSGGGNGDGGAAASGSTASDRPLQVGSIAEPTTLDPQKADDDSVYMVTYRVYESLYDFDENGDLVPVLAASDPRQVDPTTWEIKLRDGVEFSDGEAFDADAAVHSFDRILSKDVASDFAEVQNIAGAKKTDASTIEVKTKEPDYLFPAKVRVVKMVPPGVDDIVKTPVGTGPYLLDRYDAGSRAVLTANPGYWGDKPAIKEVSIRFIPDPGTRMQSLQAGEIDVMLDPSPDQVDQAPQIVPTQSAIQFSFVAINNSQPPVDDPRVRQALNYAIDKEALAKSLFGDYAAPSACQLGDPSLVAGTNPSLKAYPYDPEQAKQLLREAGAEGATIKLMWSTGVFPQDRAMGEAVAGFWRDVGLKVDMRIEGFNPYVKDLFQNGPDAVSTFGATDVGYHHIDRAFFYYFNSEGPTSRVSDPALDKQIEQAATEPDEAKRQALYEEIGKAGCDDARMVFLLAQKGLVGAQENIDYKIRPDVTSKMYYDAMSYR